MNNNDRSQQPDTHNENRHESGRGGSTEGAGDNQTQKQVRNGHMPADGLDHESRKKFMEEKGESGNKKSENQSNASK